jgi:hypothetical protein
MQTMADLCRLLLSRKNTLLMHVVSVLGQPRSSGSSDRICRKLRALVNLGGTNWSNLTPTVLCGQCCHLILSCFPLVRNSYNVHTTGYRYRVESYKASHATSTIFWSIVRPHLSSNHSWFIHQFLPWLQETHLVAKQGETWGEMAAEFCL